MKSLNGRQVAVFDLDDTLSDTSHRRHLIEVPKGERGDWAGFYAACGADPGRQEFIAMALELQKMGVDLVILSGRADSEAEKTSAWLASHGIEPKATRLRPKGSFEKSARLKSRWLAELVGCGASVVAAFDDEDSNIEAFRSAGTRCIDAKDGRAARSEFDQIVLDFLAAAKEGPSESERRAPSKAGRP